MAKRIPNRLQFKVALSDLSGLDGTLRCTDDQWNAIFAVLMSKVEAADVLALKSATEQKGESRGN